MKLCLLGDAGSIHTRRWAEQFARWGHEVHLVSMRPAPYAGVTVHVVRPPLGRGGYLVAALRARRRVRALAPDLVHAHYASSYGLWGALCGRRPLLLSVWGSDVHDFPRQGRLQRRLLQWNLSRADRLCATSEALARETAAYAPPGTRIHLTPFGVDTDRFRPRMKGAHLPGIVLGTARTLDRTYGLDVLLEAFALLERDAFDRIDGISGIEGGARLRGCNGSAAGLGMNQMAGCGSGPHPLTPSPKVGRGGNRPPSPLPKLGEGQGVRARAMPTDDDHSCIDPVDPVNPVKEDHLFLRIAGDGPERAALQRQAARLGISDRVEFLGALPHDQMPEFLAGLYLFVNPSRAESFGVAALEAAACGVPVVASRVGGLPEVVADGETGLLVQPEEPAALAAAVATLIRDPARRQAMGLAARARVLARYDWQSCARAMVRLYEEVTRHA